MHMHRPDLPLAVYGDLATAAFDFLAAVEPSGLALVVGFDRLRVDDEGARRGFIAVFFRRLVFKSKTIFDQTPRSRMRQT